MKIHKIGFSVYLSQNFKFMGRLIALYEDKDTNELMKKYFSYCNSALENLEKQLTLHHK